MRRRRIPHPHRYIETGRSRAWPLALLRPSLLLPPSSLGSGDGCHMVAKRVPTRRARSSRKRQTGPCIAWRGVLRKDNRGRNSPHVRSFPSPATSPVRGRHPLRSLGTKPAAAIGSILSHFTAPGTGDVAVRRECTRRGTRGWVGIIFHYLPLRFAIGQTGEKLRPPGRGNSRVSEPTDTTLFSYW